MKRLALLFVIIPLFLNAQTPFSTDSALIYLKTISVTIGARPMGSPNERLALEFALSKFREFGLNEAYLMPIEAVHADAMSPSSYNTASGVAVAVHRGKTNRIIVIGGHIDSASPTIPGANDDGSGSAAVLELARVLSKEPLQSTIVFCLFGGEEAGLIGSKHFANIFPQLDSVVMMLQLDMANGGGILIPTINSSKENTPVWLVQAAYEEFARLKSSGLFYTTHFFSAMNMVPGGGVGSDHEPFLEKNIPAIDFTSDMNDPIHTPQDDFEHFNPSGLKRSGDLVYALVHRFDDGVPPEKTSKYFLWQIGKRAVLFPLWLLTGFIVLSIALGLIALFFIRKRRIEIIRKQRPIIPAIKLFLVALVIQTCVWLSENLVGVLKGVRFPWMTQPEGYFVLGFLAALVGIALSLKITPHLNLSKDPYRWFLRACIFLLTLTILMLFLTVKVALYPAIALFFLALAMLVRLPILKLLFWMISPHFMFRLMFSEGFIFFGRMMGLNSPGGLSASIITHAVYIIFFALWSFPFLLGFAAVYFDSGIDLLWLKQWKTKKGVLTIGGAFLICVMILVFQSSYSDTWRQNVTIDQSVDMNTGSGKVVLKSSDYLKHLRIHLAEKDTVISTYDREILLKEFTFDRTPWIRLERTISTSGDSSTTFDMMVKIHFKYRPRSFSLIYSSGKNKLTDISTPFVSNTTEHTVSLKWESFPDTSMIIPIHFKVDKADSVTESIEARFVEMVEPVRIEKELANIIPRTTFRRTEVIKRMPVLNSSSVQ